MAHQLTMNGSKAEMASLVGTNPWHGLGQELAEGASIDQWIVQAGMDWKVQRSAVRYATAANQSSIEYQKWDDNVVLFRSDNKLPLGLVSDGFKIVQPKQVLEFFRDLCETNHFKMRTAGTLFGGKKFWALADIGHESYVLNKADKVKGRLLLVTACDGSMKTQAKFVAECVVCNNTLTVAQNEGGRSVGVSHRSVFVADDVKAQLGVSDAVWNAFIKDTQALASRFLPQTEATDLTVTLLAGEEVVHMGKARVEVEESRGFKKIMSLFSGEGIASDISGRKNSRWGWLNAVTEYADHHIAARSVDNRFNSSQFGSGEKMKNEALQIAVNA